MKTSLFKILMALVGFLAMSFASAFAVETNEAIKQMVFDTYDLDPMSYEIEITSSQIKLKVVDPADLSLKAISQKDPIGPFTLVVSVTDNEEVIDKGQVRLRIRRFADVFVAQGSVKRHEELHAGLFEQKRMEVTSLREQSVGSTGEIEGQRAKRSMRKGGILTVDALEPIPDIEVGAEVSIVYEDAGGLCTITAPGRVMQTGWAGEQIRVKNTVSGKVITARVVDDRSVTVDP